MNRSFTDSFAPALGAALVAASVVAGTLGARDLDADGAASVRAERARIAAASPEAVRVYARLMRDKASPSGWSALVTGENPADEEVGVDGELALTEMVGGEMSRAGPTPTVRYRDKIHLDLAAHGKAEIKVAIPKGTLRSLGARMAVSTSARVAVASIRKADGTVVAARAPAFPQGRRFPPVLRRIDLDDPIAEPPPPQIQVKVVANDAPQQRAAPAEMPLARAE